MKATLALVLISTTALLASVEDKETIRQTHAVSRGLEVSIISGKIRVMGGTSNAIEVEAIKTVRADDQSALDLGKREVKLNMDMNGDRLRVCEEGPYGGCGKKNDGCRDDCRRGYSVHFDVTVRVPTNLNVNLKNVNGGIEAKAVHGNFDVKSVNGTVSVLDVAGAGVVHTVNGAVHLSFVSAPTGAVEAKTVNGAIDVAFPRTTNAVLQFNTLHGGVFTNFPANLMQDLSPEPPTVERSDRGTRIRSKGKTRVKLGAGGPDFSFSTVNGSIEIKERN
ncbi:MAG: hypothetical protein HY820_16320 [Acidobacteria bacterium]|nr:hypothetical protein [Acidobacteriota bacterium]